MNAEVREWIAKAEGDFAIANRELVADEAPNHDAVCFHAQQCIEKLMKALLLVKGITPPRTHDLVYLAHLLTPHCPTLRLDTEDLATLTNGAVEFRSPGHSASKREAVKAHSICKRLRSILLAELPGKASRS
jgi:HEPN domain-containing protein